MNDLSIIMRQMCVYAERHLAEFELGFPEMVVIMHLADKGPSNQETIARTFEVDKGAISKTIAKLEAKGLVTRQVNPDNRREKLVTLDASSQPILQKMRTELVAWDDAVFAGISDADRQTLQSALTLMAANSSALLYGGHSHGAQD
jgi:DNA-binding MarR family transcriptional regulator